MWNNRDAFISQQCVGCSQEETLLMVLLLLRMNDCDSVVLN